MVLSRNDKIIAALAVVILIAAAIAIILYQPAEEEIIESQMEKTYSVTWTMYPGEKTITDGLYAEKKSPYTGTFSIDDVPDGSVLTSVKVQVKWQDDRVYGLRKTKGRDTLTVDIGLVGGGSQTHNAIGSGNETLMFTICDMPSVDSVEANDSYIAEEIIRDMFTGKNSASFDVTASVKIGEPIWRLLKRFMDKGNGFNLKVYYEYYTPTIEEPKDEIPPPEDTTDETTSYLGMMVATGNFGRI